MILSKGRGDAPTFFTSFHCYTTTSRRHLLFLFLLLSALAFTTCGATAADTQFTESNDNVARGLVGGAVVAS